MPCWRSVAAAIIASLLFAAPAPLRAQGVNVTARAGIAVSADAYQSNCGHGNMAYGLDVQGRGRFFPQLSVDRFGSSGGGDVLCLPIVPTEGTAVGGLLLEGATRIGLGAGARIGGRLAQLEGAVMGGVVSGRPGYAGVGDTTGRRARPHVGGQASLVLLRFVTLSAGMHWTRLSFDITSATVGNTTTRTSWSLMTTWQVGLRVPIGR